MRRVRIAILIFFIIVAAVFAYTFVKRRISVDYSAPVIEADSDTLMVSIKATEEDLLKGMRAIDNIDGDVTRTLVVVSKSKFASRGVLHVNYAAFDGNNNVGTYTREVTYLDYVSPRFHLYAPLRYASGTTGNDFLKSMTAEDCLDGNITQQIKINLGKTTAVSSTATIQDMNIQVTNSCGDSSVLDLTVSMEDYLEYSQQAPALREYIAYVPRSGVIDLRSYLIGIWAAGSVRSFGDTKVDPNESITIDKNGLDLNTPGRYDVIFRLKGESGEQLGTATLIVIVED